MDIIDERQAYEELANAIILRAYRDYMQGIIRKKGFYRFVNSQWFETLTDLDKDFFIELAEKEKAEHEQNRDNRLRQIHGKRVTKNDKSENKGDKHDHNRV